MRFFLVALVALSGLLTGCSRAAPPPADPNACGCSARQADPQPSQGSR